MASKDKSKAQDFNREDYNWTDNAVVGMALKLKGGSIDSNGQAIDPCVFYEVGKHKENGKVCIIPTDRNMKHDFANDMMKRNNKFN